MEEHADKAADAFVESLSMAEMEQLEELFGVVEKSGVPLEPMRSSSAALDAVKEACEQFLATVGGPTATAGKADTLTGDGDDGSTTSTPSTPTAKKR